jgi:hypothetical protein
MNLGRGLMLNGKLKKGVTELKKAKDLFVKHFGQDHPHVQGCDRIIQQYNDYMEENKEVEGSESEENSEKDAGEDEDEDDMEVEDLAEGRK